MKIFHSFFERRFYEASKRLYFIPGIPDFLAFCVSAPGWAQTVVTYPAPEGEAVTDGYTVSVNGQPVDVYSAQSEYFDGDYYFAYFDFSGTVDIEIKSVFPMSQTLLSEI